MKTGRWLDIVLQGVVQQSISNAARRQSWALTTGRDDMTNPSTDTTDDTEPTVATEETAEYQGHPSHSHWNVALWFGNDEGLYRTAMEAESPGALESMCTEGGFTKTPEGVAITTELFAYAWHSVSEGRDTAGRPMRPADQEHLMAWSIDNCVAGGTAASGMLRHYNAADRDEQQRWLAEGWTLLYDESGERSIDRERP